MSDALTQHDSWLNDKGPAAIVIREYLSPVEGADGVFFPATYVAQEGADKDRAKFQGGYNIDIFLNGKNVCLVDSVGSQANRIEPLFAQKEYAGLVPQIIVQAGNKRVNLLDANHRAADVLFRCSSQLRDILHDAFRAVLAGNAEPLAKIAPTSLVFGVWDSRVTYAKVPRLISSTIRAYDVRKITRSANYLVQQQLDYIKDGIMPEWDQLTDAEKKELSKKGFQNALASATHGGVIADSGIRRDASLNLAAIRLLSARDANGMLDEERTLALRRYILGLALTALTAQQSTYLRQGCNLVPMFDQPREVHLVHGDGKRESFTLSHTNALAFAEMAANKFVVGNSGVYQFDAKLAEEERKGADDKVKGEIVSVNVDSKMFTLKQGGTKPDIELQTTDATIYLTGKLASTFDALILTKAKVRVEVANGCALKVTGK